MDILYGTVGTIAWKGSGLWSFEWTVPDIFQYARPDECIVSPRLVLPDSEWYLQMCPYGRSERGTAGDVTLYLCWAKDSLSKRRVKFTLGVKTSGEKIEAQDEVIHEFDRLDGGHGYGRFIRRSDLVARKDELAPSGALTVTCTLTLDSKLVRLLDDLEEMFTSEKGSDATVRVGDRTFAVHRGILESRSPVFAAMFEADMREKRTHAVDIVDCDPEAFGDFLLYLYTAKVEKLPRTAFQLYRIADKYDVQGLKSECLTFALDNLGCENVLDALSLAHQFDEEELKDKAQVVFNENFKSINPTDEWISFMKDNPSLANHLLVKMWEKMKYKDRSLTFSTRV